MIIFLREMGNNSHGLNFPVMVGLASGLSGSTVCLCMKAEDIGSDEIELLLEEARLCGLKTVLCKKLFERIA